MADAGDRRQRPTLVFLPAMLCNDELYRPQIEGLRDFVEPLTLTVAQATMAEAAAAVLRRAPPLFLLAGTSYGGSLALEVVTLAPSRVLGLWLMGCSPGPHNDPTAALSRNDRVKRGEFDGVVDELASTITYGPGPLATSAVSSFRRMARQSGPSVFLLQNTALLGRIDRRADLVRIACPTLLVWGREDRFAALQHGVEMSALIPGARLVVLDECGHLPTLERPDSTIGLAREWLGRIGVKDHSGRNGELSVIKAQAQALAQEWIEAFNNHDLERILSHYADAVELKSLLVTKLLGDPAGTVRGKPALRSYYARGLAAAPDLRFDLLGVFAGVSSVAMYLRSSVRGLQLEVMELDTDGRIARVLVHHRDPS